MRRPFLAAAALCGALLLPGIAAAQSLAYAIGLSNMRAGPGLDFPVIAQVRGGSQVNVIGCLPDYSWCDSAVQGYRGWVSTTRLEFAYAGRRVLVPQYSTYFGAPVIGFDFGYWDNHYRDRSFYSDRDRYRFDDDRDDRRDRRRRRDEYRPEIDSRNFTVHEDPGDVIYEGGPDRRRRRGGDGFGTGAEGETGFEVRRDEECRGPDCFN